MPEDDRLLTEGLVNSYIHDPNTLVLCVLVGSDDTLDKGAALKLLTDAGKLESTIIALTKSDKVHEDDVEDNIFKRVLLKFDTSPTKLEGLKGCVAVVNRKHQDSSLTLEQAADKELEVFAKMLHEAQGEYKDAAMQHQLAARLTSKQLMVMLDKMYHAHITSKWVDATLVTIAGKQSEVLKTLESLGPAPETMSHADVLTPLFCRVSLQSTLCISSLCLRLSACMRACLLTSAVSALHIALGMSKIEDQLMSIAATKYACQVIFSCLHNKCLFSFACTVLSSQNDILYASVQPPY